MPSYRIYDKKICIYICAFGYYRKTIYWFVSSLRLLAACIVVNQSPYHCIIIIVATAAVVVADAVDLVVVAVDVVALLVEQPVIE